MVLREASRKDDCCARSLPLCSHVALLGVWTMVANTVEVTRGSVGHQSEQTIKYFEKCQVKKHDFRYITPGGAKFGFERGFGERCLLCPHLTIV